MSSAIRRHTGNYAAILLLLFLAAVGLDWLLVHFGWRPIAGCLLRPFLQLVLGLGIAIWMMSVGFILCLFRPSRSAGTWLLIGGVLIGVLPQLLEAYLQPLCAGAP